MQNKISKSTIFLILCGLLLFGVLVHDQINATLNQFVGFECVGIGSYANTNCYDSSAFDPVFFFLWGIILIVLAVASLRDKISKINTALILVNGLTIGVLIHDQLNYSFNTNYCSGFQSYFYVNFLGRECSAGALDLLYFGALFIATFIVLLKMGKEFFDNKKVTPLNN